MEYITIVLICFLVLLLIAIALFIVFIINTQNANAWNISPWIIDSSITTVNNLSCCITGMNHCITDAILAEQSNAYNSYASAVYISNDNGKTFTYDIFPIFNLQVYGISYDGYKITGISQDLSSGKTDVWMSTDGNFNWSKVSTPLTKPYGITMDINGTYLCVCGNDSSDSILYCNNFDTMEWNETDAPSGNWLSVLMCKDTNCFGIPLLCTALYSGNGEPDLYYSTDGCVTWTASTTLNAQLYSSVENTNNSNCNKKNNIKINTDPLMSFAFQSMSSDGTYISVIINTCVFISSDRGINWTESNTPDGITDWCTISVSSDGKTQLLCSNVYGVYQSTDYGMNWTSQTAPTQAMLKHVNNISGTVTSWVSANIFEGGQSATTFEYFYYTYNSTPTLYITLASVCTIIFIIMLVLSIYYKWFTLKYDKKVQPL